MQLSASAVEISQNTKTGPVSATYVSQKSCPKDCPLFENGCYAELGLVGIHTRRLNKSPKKRANDIARDEAKAIRSLSGRRDLRLHVVGDCRTDAAARIVGGAAREHKKKHNRSVWTYSHAWRKVLRRSWGRAVSVLASVESVRDIKRARKRGYATAIVLREFPATHRFTLNGENIQPCPAQTSGVDCVNCRLCFNDEYLKRAKLSIGFLVHGADSTLFRIRRALARLLD